jgi:hypothetical protein
LTVTGQHLAHTPLTIECRQEELLHIHRAQFGEEKARDAGAPKAATAPPGVDDAEIIRRASEAGNGAGEKFKRLWAGDRSGDKSASEADLALCNYLAFWCGPDPERIAALVAQSGLFRDKWQQREDYRRWTIDKALEGKTEFFDWSKDFCKGWTMGELGGDSEQEWPDPIPLAEIPDVPPFPVAVFPDKVRTPILEASAAMPCPPDYFATPFIALAGSSIGGSRRLAIKTSHVQGVTLYAAVVAPPGSAKSPALEKVMDPVRDAEEKIFQDWQKDMDAYKSAMEAYETAKKKRENLVPQKPTRPVLTRLTVTDATAEALVPILQENPRGVTMVRDELTAWIASMNQYREGGRGADQQFWLSAWSNSTVLVDRKKTHEEGPLYVRQPYISVIGGLTPEKLKTLRGDRSRQKAEQDGFMDRLLFSHPSEPRAVAENWSNVSKESLNQLGEVLTALREVEGASVQDEKGGARSRPWIVKLTDDARSVWQQFTEDHAVERNADDFPDHLAGPWSKLRGYCARLALILHYIRRACKETQSDDVDAESMSRAVILVNYYKDHAKKVYAVMDADPQVARAKKGGPMDQEQRQGAIHQERGPARIERHIQNH